jgi:hypothetical protein
MNSPGISLITSGLVILFLCSAKYVSGYENGVQMPSRPIEEVLKEHTHELMSIPGVVGTAQGLCDNRPCIKVFVINRTRELEQKIPKFLEGYPVVIEESGEFHALPKNKVNRKLIK